MHQFRNLDVWHQSMRVAERVYGVTHRFPTDERFGLVQQMRRAAVSIPSNIAEGSSRRTSADFRRFLRIAMGSACELETQIVLSERFGYIDLDEAQELISEVDRSRAMLVGLSRSLNDTSVRNP